MESSLVVHEEGGVERGARGGGKNTRFNLSLIVASLCTSYCNFIPPMLLEVAPQPRRRGDRVTFLPRPLHLLHPCFAPGSLRYDVIKFYRSQNFLTSLFLNINETVSPVVLFRQLTLISFTETSIHIFDECESPALVWYNSLKRMAVLYVYIYIIAIIETLVNPCTSCVNFLRTSPLSQVVLLHKDRGQLRERSWNETGSKFHNYRTPVYNRDNARKVFNASSWNRIGMKSKRLGKAGLKFP